MRQSLHDVAGMPYDGLQPVGHVKGRPEYIHHPLYYNVDETLYTQIDNTHVDKADGDAVSRDGEVSSFKGTVASALSVKIVRRIACDSATSSTSQSLLLLLSSLWDGCLKEVRVMRETTAALRSFKFSFSGETPSKSAEK